MIANDSQISAWLNVHIHYVFLKKQKQKKQLHHNDFFPKREGMALMSSKLMDNRFHFLNLKIYNLCTSHHGVKFKQVLTKKLKNTCPSLTRPDQTKRVLNVNHNRSNWTVNNQQSNLTFLMSSARAVLRIPVNTFELNKLIPCWPINYHIYPTSNTAVTYFTIVAHFLFH